MARPKHKIRFTVYDSAGETLRRLPEGKWEARPSSGSFATYQDFRSFRRAMKAVRRINSRGGIGIIEKIQFSKSYNTRIVACTYWDEGTKPDLEDCYASRSFATKP